MLPWLSRAILSSSGSDLDNVHRGNLNRQRPLITPDKGAAPGERLAIVDDPRLGGCSTHVEGNDIVEAERPADRLRTNDAGSGPGFQHADAILLCLVGVEQTPRRLHHEEGTAEASISEMMLNFVDIRTDTRTDVGVSRNRRHTLKFAIFARQFV